MQKHLSYDNGISDLPLKGETIGEALRQVVSTFKDREVLVSDFQHYRATYGEFMEQVEQVAKSLLAYGIKQGDRVGIWAPNRYEWVIIQYATALVGAIMVNINPGYKITGLRYALEQSRVDLLIASANFRKTDYIELLNKIRPSCIYPKRTVIIDHDWEDFLKAGEKISNKQLTEREAMLQFDDPINIQYTSGTTGYPKGATLSHHNILNNGFFIGERLRYTEYDKVCLPVPFYHCFGMVLGNMAIITHGGCIVISGDFFDPEQVLKVVEKEKCTSLYGVPTMFIAELELPNFNDFDLTSLRTGVMAGAPCPIDTMRKVQSLMHMTEVTVCYGMTETSPVSAQSCTDTPLEFRVSTVGKVHPHVEIKIISPETGMIVPRGVEGELCTRGYSVMLGYWDNPEDTKATIDDKHWLHTGDVAKMDEEGYISIVGRIKDIIIRGGENISPKEIEDFLIMHEGVVDVQVIGVYSERYGEEVMAWIKPREGYTLTEEILIEYCRGQIATYKIPRYWKFTGSFPMTISGKIRKVEMREISEKELGLIRKDT